MTPIDLAHLQTWIRKEDTRSELLTPAIAARFNATFDVDREPQNGDVAPLMIHLCLAPPAKLMSELGRDGHPELGGFLPPVPLPRRMWAGGKFTFEDHMRIGETVTRRSIIRDVALKNGRSGPLCFVTVDHHITSDERAVLAERQDIVYRPATDPVKDTRAPAQPGVHRRILDPSAALLFRYSALTFNGHRIHYDAPFAHQEGYPGLIVHGPLQASLLCRMAADLRGAPPAEFTFRSMSPLFDDANFTLNTEDTDDGMRLWTAYENGPVAMEASAIW